MKRATEVLLSAAFVLTPEEHWTQRAFARNWIGRPVDVYGPHACCFCVAGAIQSSAPTESLYTDALDFLRDAVGTAALGNWNDTHTHAEILDALYRAAELAEQS